LRQKPVGKRTGGFKKAGCKWTVSGGASRYNDPKGAGVWRKSARRKQMIDIKKKLQDEIATLEYELRNELPREILKARAHGDLSENAEYHAAKERQGLVNARLGQLQKRLAEFSMIDFSRIPHDKVGLGSHVVVLDTRKNEEIHYELVTSEEADAPSGKISTSSPIGRALINKEVGDTVKTQTPGGDKELEILTLKTIHELAK
jgi:transcription elongation factor GreA